MIGSPLATEVAGCAGGIEDRDAEDLAGAIAVAEAAADAILLLVLRLLALQDEADVAIDDVVGRALGFDAAVEQEDGAVAERFDQAEIVGDEEDGDFAFAEFLELADAAVGEDGVADREGFVDDENFGIDVDGGGEGEADVHAAGVFLDGALDELADLREGLDGGHGAVDFGAAESHDLAVEVDVLAAGEFGVESGAEFEQGGDAPAGDDASRGGLENAADDLEQRALAAAVGADEAETSRPFRASKPMSLSAQKSVWRGLLPGSISRRRSLGRR